jgi:TonB-linked SusC/RagA family outer membrane protein
MKTTLSTTSVFWRKVKVACCQILAFAIFGVPLQASVLNGQSILETKITLNAEGQRIKKVLEIIEQQAKVRFIYSPSTIDSKQKVSVRVKDQKLDQLLKTLFQPLSIHYSAVDDRILLKPAQPEKGAAVSPETGLLDDLPVEDRTVKGKVSDEKGDGLPGVSILVKGTQQGTTTNIDGAYSVVLPDENAELVFSFVGYVSQEVKAGNQTTINIALKVDQKSLDEVVVIGYGSQSRGDISSAIASLSVADKKIAELPITGPEQVLQGRLSGVNVTQNTGTPGGRSTVRIRGASSITGGNDPLYVIDGVPINTGSYSTASGNAAAENPLSSLSPGDIESMEVLKDAAAAAIYGSRASNGVILVTTKRGKTGAAKISFNTYYGVQKETKRLSLLDGPSWGALVNEARTNVGMQPYFADPSSLPSTDWQDVIFRSAAIQSYDLSVSGGSEKTQFMVSGNYYDQTGVVIGSGYKRGNVRINLDQTINDRLSGGVNLTLSRSKTDRIDAGTNTGIVSAAIIKSPAIPLYLEDGTLNPTDPYIATSNNPALMAREITNYAFNNRVIGNAFLNLEILKGLKFRTSIGIDYLGLDEVLFVPPNALTYEGRSTNGSGTNAMTQDRGWINENTLNYSTNLGTKHRFNLLLGNSSQESKMSRTIASGTNFALESISTLESASVRNSSSTGSSWGLASYFSRLNYTFDNKLNIAASFRIDGSSRFSKNNKYGNFPSLSASYRLDKMEFMKDVTWLDDAKIRASWGRTGNQEIGNFTSRGLSRGGFNYMGMSGLAPVQLENPNLTWETTEQTNAGVDLRFFGNRLNFTFDYYIKKTRGLLLEVLLPTSSGFASSVQNVGNVQNKGIELQLGSTNIATDNFTWRTDFNIAFNRNKVTSLPDGDDRPLGFNGYASVLKVGYPLGTFFGWKILRVNPQTGNYDFEDVDGNGNDPYPSTSTDNRVLSSAQPDFTGGMTNTFTYKNFDASVFMHFTYGNTIFNHPKYSYGRMHTWFNSFTDSKDRWQKPGDETWLHRAAWGDPTRNGSVSDRVHEDGSFLKIKAINLGYTIKAEKLKRIGVQNLRVYVVGQNLFTFTKYTGFDPEVSSFGNDAQLGFDLNAYPQIKSYTLGLNIGF